MSSAEPQIYLFYTVFVNPILITQYIAIFIPSEPEFFFIYFRHLSSFLSHNIYIVFFIHSEPCSLTYIFCVCKPSRPHPISVVILNLQCPYPFYIYIMFVNSSDFRAPYLIHYFYCTLFVNPSEPPILVLLYLSTLQSPHPISIVYVNSSELHPICCICCIC